MLRWGTQSWGWERNGEERGVSHWSATFWGLSSTSGRADRADYSSGRGWSRCRSLAAPTKLPKGEGQTPAPDARAVQLRRHGRPSVTVRTNDSPKPTKVRSGSSPRRYALARILAEGLQSRCGGWRAPPTRTPDPRHAWNGCLLSEWRKFCASRVIVWWGWRLPYQCIGTTHDARFQRTQASCPVRYARSARAEACC